MVSIDFGLLLFVTFLTEWGNSLLASHIKHAGSSSASLESFLHQRLGGFVCLPIYSVKQTFDLVPTHFRKALDLKFRRERDAASWTVVVGSDGRLNVGSTALVVGLETLGLVS